MFTRCAYWYTQKKKNKNLDISFAIAYLCAPILAGRMNMHIGFAFLIFWSYVGKLWPFLVLKEVTKSILHIVCLIEVPKGRSGQATCCLLIKCTWLWAERGPTYIKKISKYVILGKVILRWNMCMILNNHLIPNKGKLLQFCGVCHVHSFYPSNSGIC